MIGTVIANTDDEEFNPYVLTMEGWREIGSDATYMTDEHDATMWLGAPGWKVIYRGEQAGMSAETGVEVNDPMTLISQAVKKGSDEIVAAQEKYLREVCEALRMTPEELAKDYVFETGPVQTMWTDGFGLDPLEVRLRQEYRLRPKTSEELEAEQARGSSRED